MRSAFSERMRTAARFSTALAFAVFLPALPVRAEKIRNHFDSDAVMRPPGFFDLLVLGAPGPAKWLILTDPNPPSAPNCLVQVQTPRPDDSIAAAMRRNYAFQDGSASTFLKKGAGRSGLILRMKDEKNFLLLLVDPAGDVVLTAYADGKPQELGRGRVTPERPWEQYGVTAAGPAISVFFNEQRLFEARDPHPVAGRVGLATAGPGEASFDEFVIEYEPERRP